MSKFLPFGEALAMARSLRLVTQKEWKAWFKEGTRPGCLPSNPDATYKGGGWQGWGHWLGSSDLMPPLFLPFAQALAFARSIGLASKAEWKMRCKEGRRPATVPSHPERAYKGSGWQGWGHWLGTGNQSTKMQQFAPFGTALAAAHSLNLASIFEWRAWCKEGMRPSYLPADPSKTYKDAGWQGWVHWLGSSDLKPAPFLPFAQALAFVRSLGLANQKEWAMWCKEGKRPATVPSNPYRTYKDGGWQGWGHWLGTGNMESGTRQFLEFDEALLVARSLRLASSTEWRAWCRSGARPANVPAAPDQVYVHDGWMGYTHWLYHVNLGPPTAPAVAPPARKRAAPTGTGGTVGRSQGTRRRR